MISNLIQRDLSAFIDYHKNGGQFAILDLSSQF